MEAVRDIVDEAKLQFSSYPGHVVVDATSPRGAVVDFAAPEVSNGTDAPPIAECASASGLASGSIFPTGDTIVICAALDSRTGATAKLDFVVTVNGPMIQLTNLLRIVQQLPPGSSLPDKVAASITSLQAADVRTTCATLRAMGNEVRAQSGKKLTPLQAQYLGSATGRVRSALSC